MLVPDVQKFCIYSLLCLISVRSVSLLCVFYLHKMNVMTTQRKALRNDSENDGRDRMKQTGQERRDQCRSHSGGESVATGI